MRLTFFFVSNPAPTDTYPLSLHDARPIYLVAELAPQRPDVDPQVVALLSVAHAPDPAEEPLVGEQDRKSTRLNSSHLGISYAVFCLKKKKETVGDKRTRNNLTTIITQISV